MSDSQLTDELLAQLETHPKSELVIMDTERQYTFEISDCRYDSIDDVIFVEIERIL